MSLLDEILARIRPDSQERKAVMDAASGLMESVRTLANERRIPGRPLLMGSVAKDTYLKDPEIDVFVAFPEDTSRQQLERWGLELGSVLEKPNRRYAEHPYTHGFFEGYEADVVPCYSLKEPSARMTAVDRTPFHLEYVKAHLKEGQKDEVRLLKQFAKGTGTYGAEARVQGLSGYLCELLILKYGSFPATLEAVSEWRPPVHLELDMEAARGFDEPLVFVDPVDGQRNVASAVSLETLATLILAGSEYLQSPHEGFFFPPSPPPTSSEELLKEVDRRGTAILALSSGAPDQPEDVVFPQLHKAEQSVVSHLESLDFRVLKSRPFLLEGEWCLMLELELAQLPPTRKHWGPPAWLKNAYDFISKWQSSPDLVSGPYIEGERLVVEILRGHRDAKAALEAILSSLSLGKHIDAEVKKGFRVEEPRQFLSRGREGVLTEFLHRQLPWRLKKSRKRRS